MQPQPVASALYMCLCRRPSSLVAMSQGSWMCGMSRRSGSAAICSTRTCPLMKSLAKLAGYQVMYSSGAKAFCGEEYIIQQHISAMQPHIPSSCQLLTISDACLYGTAKDGVQEAVVSLRSNDCSDRVCAYMRSSRLAHKHHMEQRMDTI
jgi:hypothetical protein